MSKFFYILLNPMEFPFTFDKSLSSGMSIRKDPFFIRRRMAGKDFSQPEVLLSKSKLLST